MSKIFYTERDIQDLAARGITALDVDDNVVITDMGRDAALKLGIKLARRSAAPAAAKPAPSKDEVVAKVKAAVIARLGNTADPALLEAVISRVIAQIK
jgi:hypothetical protein